MKRRKGRRILLSESEYACFCLDLLASLVVPSSYGAMVHLLLSVFLTLVLTALPAFADYATVTRVVDGDTLAILLNGQSESVRLIGVDTPELHDSEKLHRDAERTGQDVTAIQLLGRQASDFVKSFVRRGDRISLEYDQQRRDKYGRLLAFVWLADGRMLNEVIVCEGYSPAFTRYPFRRDYQARFRTCAQQARGAGKGLWGVSKPSAPVLQRDSVTDGVIRGNRRSMIYHLSTCPDYDKLSTRNIVPFTSEADARRAGYRKAGNCP